MTTVPVETRNTRSVFPIRLSDRERAQIEGAAQSRQLTIGGFVRQAALQASAIVQGKASVKEQAPRERRPPLTMVDPEPPKRRMVEGEWIDW